jgi:hypothetical protein
MASSTQLQNITPANPFAILFSRVGLLSILLGIIVILFNFSTLIEKTVNNSFPGSTFSGMLGHILALPKELHSVELLYTCLFACFCGLWLYLAMLLILSAVRRSIALAAQGLISFSIGVLILPLLGWCALLLYWVLWVFVKVVAFVLNILGIILHFVLFLMHYLWPVPLGIIVISLLVWAWQKFRFKGFAFIAGAGAVLYLLWPYLRNLFFSYILPALQWIENILVVVFGWIGFLVRWILIVFLVVAACIVALSGLACVGYFVVDQFRTAWECGRSRKGAILGSLSLGVSLSLIFIVSVGNLERSSTIAGTLGTVVEASTTNVQSAGTPSKKKGRKRPPKSLQPKLAEPLPTTIAAVPIQATIDLAAQNGGFALRGTSLPRVFTWSLPHSMREWASESFHHAHAPTFDAIVLLLVLLISLTGLARGIFTKEEFNFKYKFYNRDLLVLVAIPVVLLIGLLAASETNQE